MTGILPQSRTLGIFGLLLFFCINTGIHAQESDDTSHRAVVLDISARVIEQNMQEIWNETHQRITIPGRPVEIKMVGANIIVVAQFVPYLQRKGRNILVAQGQIWIDVPNQGIRYQTSMQSIPLAFNEPVYFFPLGSGKQANDAQIEIVLTMRPYTGAAPSETGDSDKHADNQNQGSAPP
jgi:hypothetical protein